MIVAKTEDGVLIIGLSEKNVQLLREGKPILKLDVPGMPKFVITYGETEQDILDELIAHDIGVPPLNEWKTTRGH